MSNQIQIDATNLDSVGIKINDHQEMVVTIDRHVNGTFEQFYSDVYDSKREGGYVTTQITEVEGGEWIMPEEVAPPTDKAYTVEVDIQGTRKLKIEAPNFMMAAKMAEKEMANLSIDDLDQVEYNEPTYTIYRELDPIDLLDTQETDRLVTHLVNQWDGDINFLTGYILPELAASLEDDIANQSVNTGVEELIKELQGKIARINKIKENILNME